MPIVPHLPRAFVDPGSKMLIVATKRAPTDQIDGLPAWLRDYEGFSAHLDEQLADEGSSGKGLRFVTFVLAVLPRVPEASSFSGFELNPRKSHDKGVDILTALNHDGQQLLCQSKFRIRRAEELDSVLSKFEAYEAEYGLSAGSVQDALFEVPGTVAAEPPAYFVATAAKLDQIVARYKESKWSSRPFFDRLTAEGRLTLVDGNELLRTLQSIYRKSFEVPSKFTISAPTSWIHVNSVHLGVVSGAELVRLYDAHGDGLFFENIRSFLGLERNQDRESVNRRVTAQVPRVVDHAN